MHILRWTFIVGLLSMPSAYAEIPSIFISMGTGDTPSPVKTCSQPQNFSIWIKDRKKRLLGGAEILADREPLTISSPRNEVILSIPGDRMRFYVGKNFTIRKQGYKPLNIPIITEAEWKTWKCPPAAIIRRVTLSRE